MYLYSHTKDASGSVNIITHLPSDTSVSFVCTTEKGDRSFRFKLGRIEAQPDEFQMPGKMLVISDIEGNFGAFEMILRASGVTDDSLNWNFGSGHLVLPGDFFDRGSDVLACLWLIYKLEQEAAASGGRVHFILGNHEMMNIRGNYKYVASKYFEDASALGLPYEKWFDRDSELGRWLRAKNTAVKIGSMLFVHGGISPQLINTGMDMSEINMEIRRLTDIPRDSLTERDKLLLGEYGPLWFRGIAQNMVSESEVDTFLAKFGVSQIVIGHTLFDEITRLYCGKVTAIDLHHAENYAKGVMKALYVENGQSYVIDGNGSKTPLAE